MASSSRHGDGGEGGRLKYNIETCFDPFPCPWLPEHEPIDSPGVEAIAEAARELLKKRAAWLNPPETSEDELKKRTLTNLYNGGPTWLMDAHRKLDEAVFAVYGWPCTLTDSQILERLLALNHQRATAQTQN